MKTINKIGPFKNFILQNFPFIEEDFDALTNYELLCHVVNYCKTIANNFNDVLDNFDELDESFQNLKNYIDNYFDNLDVQDEINNKLDLMVQSGTMAEIINEQIFEELNTKIGDLEDLTTIDNSSLVNAVNEVNTATNNNKIDIGNKSYLTTDEKDTLVEAINEVNSLAKSNAHEIEENVLLKEHIEIITGTITLDANTSELAGDNLCTRTYKTINYPTGFSKSNTHCLGIKLKNSSSNGDSSMSLNDVKLTVMNVYGSYPRDLILGDSNMTLVIANPNTTQVSNLNYEIVLLNY